MPNKTPIALGLLTLALALPAAADTVMGSAHVTILDTLTIEETSIVDFGAIPGDDGDCAMNAGGALAAANGSKCQGSGQLGQFSISGSAGQSVNVAVNAGAAGGGVSFQPQLLSGTDATLVGGNTVALIGGQLSLAGAAPGLQSLTYYITVNYN